MRLAVVTRVRNEDDIVEAFVRHHARIVDHLILLDDGSTDRTPEILAALKQEGLPITVYRGRSVTFVESAFTTFLLRRAAALGAEWVLCLDCDEFIDARSLPNALAAVPADVLVAEAELLNYHPTSADAADEWIVPMRLRHRAAATSGVFKVFVRGRLAELGGEIANGNHGARLHGAPLPAARLPEVALAHFGVRSGWQMLAKAVCGRLKVLACGGDEAARGSSSHYTTLLGHLADHPEWLLFDAEFLSGRRPPEFVVGGVVEHRMDYRGGELRYTWPSDPRVHAARSVMAYLELLAERHGRLLDAHQPARANTLAWDGELTGPF